MSHQTTGVFFTPQHRRLSNIASILNILAWVVLAITLIAVGTQSNILYFSASQKLNCAALFPQKCVAWKDLGFSLHFFVYLLKGMINAAVYWLVLKGVAAGLNMIVETDLNYRGKAQEAQNE